MISKNILVTGVSGLIGYAVAQELARQGRDVFGLVRRPFHDGNFPTFEADLTDIHRLHSFFRDHSVDSVVHSGALSGPMVARDNPYSICKTNITGTANILEVARIHGVRRIVYTSSTTAYGNTPTGPVGENTELRPIDVYGATKASGEHLVHAYSVKYGLECVSLRISWVYGPRRRTDCLIRTMIEDALDRRPTRVNWGLGFYRQYVYVDDVSSSIIAALEAPGFPQSAYNVTGGTYLTIDQTADILRTVLPQAETHLGQGPDPVDTVQAEFDISAVRRDLGYVPRFTLVQGIEAYTKWIQEQRAQR